MTTYEWVILGALLAFLLIYNPLFSLREMAKLRATPEGERGPRRRRLYRWTMIEQWAAVAILLPAWFLVGRTASEIRLDLGFSGWQWLALGLTLLVTGVMAFFYVRAAGREKDRAKVREQMGELDLLTPRTPDELRSFGWLSFTAGVCEEILVRGLLMTLLAGFTGLWPAVLLSSVIFGVAHAYQGAGGIFKTGVVGLILALIVVFTGSLLPAILLHVVLDLTQGRLLFAAVTTPEPQPQA